VVECENYKQPHQIQKLLGAPPSYVGYKDPGKKSEAGETDPSALFARVNLVASRKGSKNPITVILLDEIEKASDEFLDVLLGIFDKGKIALPNNTEADFTDCILVMTSNLGTAEMQRQSLGFLSGRTQSQSERQRLESAAQRALRETFRPEFLNRIDEIIVFEPLTEAELEQIVDLLVDDLLGRLTERGVTVRLSEAARKALVQEGYDPTFGARPLRRVVQRRIENPLAKRVLSGEVAPGSDVSVDVNEAGEYTFSPIPAAPESEPAEVA